MVQFYTFGSAPLGSDVTFTLVRNASEAEQPHAWPNKLTPGQKQQIQELKYGNYPDALEAKYVTQEDLRDMVNGPFDPARHCLVQLPSDMTLMYTDA